MPHWYKVTCVLPEASGSVNVPFAPPANETATSPTTTPILELDGTGMSCRWGIEHCTAPGDRKRPETTATAPAGPDASSCCSHDHLQVMFPVSANSKPIIVTSLTSETGSDVPGMVWISEGRTLLAWYATERRHSVRWQVRQHCWQLQGYEHELVRQQLQIGEHQQLLQASFVHENNDAEHPHEKQVWQLQEEQKQSYGTAYWDQKTAKQSRRAKFHPCNAAYSRPKRIEDFLHSPWCVSTQTVAAEAGRMTATIRSNPRSSGAMSTEPVPLLYQHNAATSVNGKPFSGVQRGRARGKAAQPQGWQTKDDWGIPSS
jgi:hypothetical protein